MTLVATEKPVDQRVEELWKRYVATRDSALREELILQYRPLVKYVAARVIRKLPASVEFDDLVSSGTFGLIEAVDRFDPARGLSFQSYAFTRIRGAILDSLRQLDSTPRSSRAFAKAADQATQRLTSELGRSPTEPEVALAMGVPTAVCRRKLFEASRSVVSLDSLYGPDFDGEGNGEIQLADPDDAAAGAALEQEELQQTIACAIRQLGERDQLVLDLYYTKGLNLREVGQVLDVSESRVSQLHSRIITQLRAALALRLAEAA